MSVVSEHAQLEKEALSANLLLPAVLLTDKELSLPSLGVVGRATRTLPSRAISSFIIVD
jgi:hypothetical protein